MEDVNVVVVEVDGRSLFFFWKKPRGMADGERRRLRRIGGQRQTGLGDGAGTEPSALAVGMLRDVLPKKRARARPPEWRSGGRTSAQRHQLLLHRGHDAIEAGVVHPVVVVECMHEQVPRMLERHREHDEAGNEDQERAQIETLLNVEQIAVGMVTVARLVARPVARPVARLVASEGRRFADQCVVRS